MKKLIDGFSNPFVSFILFLMCLGLGVQWRNAERRAQKATEWANCLEYQVTEVLEDMYNTNK